MKNMQPEGVRARCSRSTRAWALLGLSCLILCLSVPALATRIGRTPEGPLIKNAHAIAVVEIVDVEVSQDKARGVVCMETTTLTLIPKSFIKGSLPVGTRLSFSYMVLVDDRAPCPRIYAVFAPRARLRRTGPKKGVELIAAIERKMGAGGEVAYEVTSTYDLEDLERIKGMLAK